MATKAVTKRQRNELIPSFFPSIFNDVFKPWNDWFDTGGGLFRNVMTVPAVNIVEDQNEYKVSLAVPGMKREDFKVDLDGNMLTISAEREENKEEEEERYTRKEYNYSSFSRTLPLPNEVDPEEIEAKYEDGILKLVLPKKEEARKSYAKSIPVR